jgi:SET domain-containing protein
MVLDETDARFCAGPSAIPGAGLGLFARVPLRAGDQLEAVGVMVRRESEADTCTAYADAYKFRAGDHLLIPCGLAALANHSDRPNLEKVVEGASVFLRLLRDVEAGEELCFTYSAYALARARIG